MQKIIYLVLALAMTVSCSSGSDAIELFNGKDLSNWEACSTKAPYGVIPTETTWKVEDGVIKDSGKPQGYLQTKNEYENYKLIVEYRMMRRGNSGLLVHKTKNNAIVGWPYSIEVQMQSGSAGDFWVIGEDLWVENMNKRRAPPRSKRDIHTNRRISRLKEVKAEKGVGEWNRMEVICKGNEIIVYLNGQLINHGKKVTATKGKVCLQAEGVPVEFRKVTLIPLK